MNIKDFKERTSVRYYTDQQLTKDEMEDLIEVINNSPTSSNAQLFSALIVTDTEGKFVLGEANGGSKWVKNSTGVIVFLGDTTRNEHLVPLPEDPTLLASYKDRLIIDATIAATYTQDALASMGFGSCFVGALPIGADSVIEYFNLPESAFIVTAIAFGKAREVNAFKPKVNKVFIGKYNKNQAIKDIEEYNGFMRDYYKERGKDRDFSHQLHFNNANSWRERELVASTKYYDRVAKKYKK